MANITTDIAAIELRAKEDLKDNLRRQEEIADRLAETTDSNFTGPKISEADSSNLLKELLSLNSQQLELEIQLDTLAPGASIDAQREINEERATSISEAKPKKSKRKRQVADLLDPRRANLNIIDFSVATFINNIRKAIEAKRMTVVSVGADKSKTFSEPRLNTLYRMMGFPPSNIVVTTIGEDGSTETTARIFDREGKENTNTGLIDRKAPGEDRVLFPIIDEKIFISFGNRIRFPFINSVIQIRINKYDFVRNKVEKSPHLSQLEFLISNNIDKLIEAFPALLLKKVQKLAKLATKNNKKAQIGATDDTLDAREPNKSISDFKKGEVEFDQLKESELQKQQDQIDEESTVENILLSLLPLDDIEHNELGGAFISIINHNKTFLSRQIRKIKDAQERFSRKAADVERELASFEGCSQELVKSILSDAKPADQTIKDEISNCIGGIEILAVFSAFFSDKMTEDDLINIAFHNGIDSSHELAISAIKNPDGGEGTRAKFPTASDLEKSLVKLDKEIKVKVKQFNEKLEKSKELIQLKKIAKTVEK